MCVGPWRARVRAAWDQDLAAAAAAGIYSGVDNLTHTLVGAALGEAGLKKRTRLGMAALMIGANLPDVDMIAIPLGEMLTFRRGWTHGVLAMVVLPPVLTFSLIAWARFRQRPDRNASAAPLRPKQLLLLSAIAILTHPFLDLLNTYGVRLLMPFSDRWFYGDTLFIIDPWVWLALLIGIFLTRRRARAAGMAQQRPARIAVGLVSAYIGAMAIGSWYARAVATRAARDSELRAPARVLAAPVPANSLRRELVYDMGDAYRFGEMTLLPEHRVALRDDAVPTNLRHPAARAVQNHPEVRDFLYWSRFPFFAIAAAAEPPFVELRDARFARPIAGRGQFTVRVPHP